MTALHPGQPVQRCPRCHEDRAPRIFHTIDGTTPALAERTFAAIGVPPWDVVTARSGLKQRFYEFQGDRQSVLGELDASATPT